MQSGFAGSAKKSAAFNEDSTRRDTSIYQDGTSISSLYRLNKDGTETLLDFRYRGVPSETPDNTYRIEEAVSAPGSYEILSAGCNIEEIADEDEYEYEDEDEFEDEEIQSAAEYLSNPENLAEYISKIESHEIPNGTILRDSQGNPSAIILRDENGGFAAQIDLEDGKPAVLDYVDPYDGSLVSYDSGSRQTKRLKADG